MKIIKSITIIIITIIFLSMIYFGYTQYQDSEKYIEVTQNVTEEGLKISLKYNKNEWEVKKGEGYYDEDKYSAGLSFLNYKDKENIRIEVDYYKDLHKWTEKEIEQTHGDTGGVGVNLKYNFLDMNDLDDTYIKIAEIRGQEIYVKKDYDLSGSDMNIYQKVNKNKVLFDLSILNKDPNKIVPTQFLSITASFKKRNEKISKEEYKKLREEFIEIVKSIKITEIEK
ncbi:hypothetical protein CSB11_02325 [Candidatus Campbellbacteria bacterium]|nr:MAG: hypothetical protein CSB11_02325 [Candidatus Campbellbacteria bacterium]